MTYSVGGKVQALDYNTFANAALNINSVWGNTSRAGYGQTNISNVALGSKITSSEWTDLVDTLNKATKHQTGANSAISSDTTEIGDKVAVLNSSSSSLVNAVNNLQRNSLSAASQGPITTYTTTNNTSWRDLLTFTTTVTFANANAAMYFFNAGGQIGLSYTHSSNTTGINPLIADICSSIGTIWISSPAGGLITLSGTTFSGVTKLGGSGSLTKLNNEYGYKGLTVVPVQIAYQTSQVTFIRSIYSGTNLTISASSNVATVTITSSIDEIFGANSFVVATPTTLTVSVRPPETTILANTWGEVTVASQVTTAT